MMLRSFIMLSGGGYDVDAQLYFDRLTPQPSAGFKSAINNLVVTLKANNNWSNLDRLWITATEYQQHARISLVNPASTALTEVNSPSWSANQGYTSNGTTSYINTNYIMNNSIVYLLNDASYGCYLRTELAQDNIIDMGVIDTSPSNSGSVINVRNSTDDCRYVINFNGSPGNSVGFSSLGMTAVDRPDSLNKRQYKNGSLVQSAAESSTGRSISNLYLLCRNFLNTADRFSSRQMAMAFTGNSSLNQNTFYSAFQTFATIRGFNV